MLADVRASAPMAQVFMLAMVALLPRLALAKTETTVDLVAAPAPSSAVSEQSNKKIKMVTETLKDILQSVVNEEKQEITIHNKYMGWCTTERADIAKDLKDTQTELANAKVLSEEQVSNIESLKLFIAKSEKEIEETQDAVAQAVSLRTGENEEYTTERQINTQSLRQIDLAIKHVGKVQQQGGFLQNGVVKKLQVNAPGESSYVLGVMKGLQDKLTKTREMMIKTEKEKVQMHDSFMQTKGASLKALTDKLSEKKISLTETTAKEAGVKQKIGKLTEQVAKLIHVGDKTASTCLATEQEWKVRQADRTTEKAALNEAIRFLLSTSLEQLSSVQHSDDEEQDEAPAVFAPSFLQEASESKITDNEFYKAADAALDGEDDGVDSHMQKDTFDGVKGVVKKLIGTHADTQAEETKKQKHCETEIESTEDDKATTEDDLAATKADIEKKSSESEMLADEVKSLYESIDKMKKSVEAAGKVRKEEAALFKAGTKDRALAIKVLNQAKDVLQNFYDQKQGKFLQGRQAPPPRNAQGSARKSSASFGAVSMVQDIADDIAKEQKDAAIQEKQASDAYENLQKETAKSTDDKQQDITDRTINKAKLGVQINGLKEAREKQTNDLESINKQLTALHDSCDELLKFFDKRKKARSFEVSQLRDVMDILSGASISTRTGLVQDSDEADVQEFEHALDRDD